MLMHDAAQIAMCIASLGARDRWTTADLHDWICMLHLHAALRVEAYAGIVLQPEELQQADKAAQSGMSFAAESHPSIL